MTSCLVWAQVLCPACPPPLQASTSRSESSRSASVLCNLTKPWLVVAMQVSDLV